MIFQDPMTSLNPYLTIEKQMIAAMRAHERVSVKAARARCIEMLNAVAIPEPARRLKRYPHELSGGMRQRVMIATSLLLEPEVLVADEPTTALDVTVQAQILELLKELKRRFNTAIVIITHDLGVVAGLADRVLVMHGGELKEQGDVARRVLSAAARVHAHAARSRAAARQRAAGHVAAVADGRAADRRRNGSRPFPGARRRAGSARASCCAPSTASISRSRPARRSASSASPAAASRRSRARF